MGSRPDQLDLPGLPSAPSSPPKKPPLPPPTGRRKFQGLPDNLFFGLMLDADAAFDAFQFGGGLERRYRLKRTRPQRLLHVSLSTLGSFNGLPSGLVERASEAAASISMPSFIAEFDKAEPFNNCIVLTGGDGVSGIRMLERELAAALEKGKIREASRHFNPHVTLIYDETVIPVERMRTPVRWKVREFALIHSLVKQSTYVRRGTFALDD